MKKSATNAIASSLTLTTERNVKYVAIGSVFHAGRIWEQHAIAANEKTNTVNIAKMSKRERLPDERKSITHHFSISGHDGYITVGLYDDGRPGEIFIRLGKTGGREGSMIDAWATIFSIALQSGIPLKTITGKFKNWRFEPQGITTGKDIKFASSPIDYICRWLELKFCSEQE